MPHYHFDVHDGETISDAFGEDLPGIESARTRAMQIASSYTTHPKMLRTEGGAIIVEVKDAAGNRLFTVRLVFSVADD